MPFIGREVELGRWRLQSRRLRLRLGVNNNSGKLVAEETAALKRQQQAGLAGVKAAARWGSAVGGTAWQALVMRRHSDDGTRRAGDAVPRQRRQWAR